LSIEVYISFCSSRVLFQSWPFNVSMSLTTFQLLKGLLNIFHIDPSTDRFFSLQVKNPIHHTNQSFRMISKLFPGVIKTVWKNRPESLLWHRWWYFRFGCCEKINRFTVYLLS
jgi:hypothetical protein